MLSLSFLPWLLLLLGIVLAIPIVSFVESSRRKKALAAAASPEVADEGELEGEEVLDEEAGFAEEGGFGGEEAMPADVGFGASDDAEMAGFEDDKFK